MLSARDTVTLLLDAWDSTATPSWRHCTSGHLETYTEKMALGIAIFPTPAELLFVVFSVADMISWFLAGCRSLRRHGSDLQHGICDLTRWGKEMDMLFSLYLPPACKSKHTVGSGFSRPLEPAKPGTKARSFMWQRQGYSLLQINICMTFWQSPWGRYYSRPI